MNQALGHNVAPNLVPTFTKDTAARTRLSATAIKRYIHRAEKIAPNVRDEIRDMPKIADSGVKLDTLAKAAPEEQAEAVKAVKTGQAENIRDAMSRGPKPTPIPRQPVAPQRKASGIIGTPREQGIEMTADQYKAPASQLYDRLSEAARLVNDAKHLDEISRPKREHLARRFAAALSVSYLLKDPDSIIAPEVIDLANTAISPTSRNRPCHHLCPQRALC